MGSPRRRDPNSRLRYFVRCSWTRAGKGQARLASPQNWMPQLVHFVGICSSVLDAETALVPAAGSTSIRLQEALQQTYADIRETMTFSKEAGARRLFSPDLELGLAKMLNSNSAATASASSSCRTPARCRGVQSWREATSLRFLQDGGILDWFAGDDSAPSLSGSTSSSEISGSFVSIGAFACSKDPVSRLFTASLL